MANVLSFVLGIESAGFLSSVNTANSRLGAFLGTAAKITGITLATAALEKSFRSLGDIVGGVNEAFHRGAELQQLRNRTGQSVADLLELQRAFQNVGLQADNVGGLIFHLQKSLTGISEVGEDTSSVFSLLGLNMYKMRQQSAAQSLQELAQAFQRLDPSQAAGFASKLFGRGEASNFLVLARDAQHFTQALRDNAAAGAQMQRNAAAFQRLEISLGNLKFKSQDLFAGIAERVAPALQNILDMVNKIDLSGIGRDLGSIFGGFAGALKTGNLAEAIADSITTGFEIAVAMAPGIFAKIGEILLRVFKAPLTYLSSGMEYIFEQTAYQFTTGPLSKLLEKIAPFQTAIVRGLLGANPTAPDFSKIFAAQSARGLRFNLGTGEFGMDDITREANQAVEDGKKKAAGLWDNFIGQMNKFGAPFTPKKGNAQSGAIPPGQPFFGFDRKSFEGTSFEKIGARLTGAAAPTLLTDHAARTAINTAKMVQVLVGIRAQLRSQGYEPQNANA